MSIKLQASDRVRTDFDDGDEPLDNVSDVLFRRLMGSFATGVSVVTAKDVDDVMLGFTANAVSSVSRTPPLLLVCASRALFTLGAIRRSGYFAVNFMDQESEMIVRRFGGRSGDKFDGVDTETGVTGLPLIKDALAVAECEAYQFTEAGDHTVILGRIVGGRIAEARYPLLYFRGEFSKWIPQPQKA